MDDQAWQLVKRIFTEALQRPPEDRARLLDVACGDDAEIRAGAMAGAEPVAKAASAAS